MADVLQMTKTRDGVAWSRPLDYVTALLRNGVYDVTFTRHKESRSISQNALLWMWLACLEDATGMTRLDIYDAYCAMFLSRTVETPKGAVVTHTTSSHLSKEEFTTFLDRIAADAAEMGVQLPRPEDMYFDQFMATYK